MKTLVTKLLFKSAIKYPNFNADTAILLLKEIDRFFTGDVWIGFDPTTQKIMIKEEKVNE